MKQINPEFLNSILQSIDDRYLKFQGFYPSDFTRAYVDDKMCAIHEEAPYGSTLKATFSRSDHLFRGVVTIYSSAGKFFAMATGTKLKEVTQKIVEQLRKQLNRWKSQRFADNTLKEVSHDNDNSVA